jgi:hypothetical protein
MESNPNSVKQFIADIATKNYSNANKSLHKSIEDKLKQRIASVLNPKN